MRKTIVTYFSILAFAAVSATSAFAVELRGANGGVLVNKGAGFVPVRGSATLVAGDRVMVSANSKATLVYSEDCKVPLTPGRVVTIGKKSPCDAKAQFGDGNLGPIVLGGLGAGFIGFVVIKGVNDTKNKIASP